MRYGNTEEVILAGLLDPGTSVTIDVLNMHTKQLFQLSDNNCTESVIPGVYLFDVSKITDKPEDSVNCLYVMQNSEKKFYGKFVLSSYGDKDKKEDMDRISLLSDSIKTITSGTKADTEEILEDMGTLNSAASGMRATIDRNYSAINDIADTASNIQLSVNGITAKIDEVANELREAEQLSIDEVISKLEALKVQLVNAQSSVETKVDTVPDRVWSKIV